MKLLSANDERKGRKNAHHGGTPVGGNFSLVSQLCWGLVSLIHAQISSNRPLGPTDALGSLVELGGHIQVAYLWFAALDSIENDEGVDLEVGKVKVNVDTVEADEKVDEGLLLFGRDVGEKGRCDGITRGE